MNPEDYQRQQGGVPDPQPIQPTPYPNPQLAQPQMAQPPTNQFQQQPPQPAMPYGAQPQPMYEQTAGMPPRSGSKRKLVVIASGVIALIIIGVVGYLVFMNHGKTTGGGAPTGSNAVSTSNQALTSVTVSPSATSGYQASTQPLTAQDKQKGIEGLNVYVGNDPSKADTVTVGWGNATSSSNDDSSSQLNALKQAYANSGITTQTASVPNAMVKGSDGKTYTLTCEGIYMTLPAQAGVPQTTGSNDICIGKFNSGKQYVLFQASDPQDQNAKTVIAQFAAGITLNF